MKKFNPVIKSKSQIVSDTVKHLGLDFSLKRKRSNKYNCYLVEHTDNVKDIEWKLAFNNDGLLWRSSKFDDWDEFLKYHF